MAIERNQSDFVHFRGVVTETGVMWRVEALQTAKYPKSLVQFARGKVEETSKGNDTSVNNT